MRPSLHGSRFLLFCLLVGASAAEAQEYFPPRGDWETRRPAEVGMDAERVREAIAIAVAAESTSPRDLALAHLRSFGREPLGDAIGPLLPRGDLTGVIVRNGYVVASWGEPDRVDNTFSVTKSFLSATVGLAWDRRLIGSLDEPVGRLMAPVEVVQPECVGPRTVAGDFPQPAAPFQPFATEHNAQITWDHLLRQTSDWEGMLWCKPDWADRPAQDPEEWGTRERHLPGTVYEYNDTRVNLLALAALNVWRMPLSAVLRREVMDPIGASPTWRWSGYENSWVILDGRMVQSVSGGAHWGGGMMISAMDMARFGYLHLRDGRWDDRRILSEDWLAMARRPGSANPRYGFMNFFLNTGRAAFPAAPESAYYHLGAGTNLIYVDQEHDLVVVLRWIRQNRVNEFLEVLLSAIQESSR